MRFKLSCLTALLLAACSTPSDAAKPVPTGPVIVNGWYAGPWLGTVNYSPGITLQPLAGGVVQFDIPTLPGQVDALVKPVNVLPQSMSVAYQLSAPVYYSTQPGGPPIISVAFQRRGDNWSGKNQYEYYRWYAVTKAELAPGSNIFSVDFTSLDWFDVWGQPASAHQAEFNAARADPQAVMITFGCDPCGGRSHGVYGPAHFNLLGAN